MFYILLSQPGIQTPFYWRHSTETWTEDPHNATLYASREEAARVEPTPGMSVVLKLNTDTGLGKFLWK